MEVHERCIEKWNILSVVVFFSQAEKNAFVVADLGALMRQHVLWKTTMPLIRPFYPVSCNSSPVVIELLSALGVGFVCANKVGLLNSLLKHRILWTLKGPFGFWSTQSNRNVLISCRLKPHWYSIMMFLQRTSSCLVFASNSHSLNMPPRMASTIWCVKTRQSFAKLPVPILNPSKCWKLNNGIHDFLGKIWIED